MYGFRCSYVYHISLVCGIRFWFKKMKQFLLSRRVIFIRSHTYVVISRNTCDVISDSFRRSFYPACWCFSYFFILTDIFPTILGEICCVDDWNVSVVFSNWVLLIIFGSAGTLASSRLGGEGDDVLVLLVLLSSCILRSFDTSVGRVALTAVILFWVRFLLLHRGVCRGLCITDDNLYKWFFGCDVDGSIGEVLSLIHISEPTRPY